METYLIRTFRADMNAEGGQREVRYLVRAKDHLSAGAMFDEPFISVIDQGPHLDAQADELGIMDGGAREI